MTYRSYLDTFLLPFDMGTGHDVDEYNTRIKHQRNKLKRHFTEEGQAGEMFRCAATCTVGIKQSDSWLQLDPCQVTKQPLYKTRTASQAALRWGRVSALLTLPSNELTAACCAAEQVHAGACGMRRA